MKYSNLHQHTNFSDGKNTAEEVVLSAINCGLESIGFSDHSYTAIDESYCMLEEDYEKYHAEINRLKQKYQGKVKIFKGIELDYFSTVNASDYDYIIASVHYLYENGVCYAIDHTLDDQLNYTRDCCNGDKVKFASDYYSLLVNHVKKVKPLFVGHFDVITKFGLFDEDNEEYRKVAIKALNEVMPYCKVFEMNTGAISRKRRLLPYPERYLLEEILKRGGEIILSSDSHAVGTLTCFFDESIEILKEVGFKCVVKFDGEKLYKEYF